MSCLSFISTLYFCCIIRKLHSNSLWFSKIWSSLCYAKCVTIIFREMIYYVNAKICRCHFRKIVEKQIVHKLCETKIITKSYRIQDPKLVMIQGIDNFRLSFKKNELNANLIS